MCAIAGVLGLEVSEKTIECMLQTMRRRGPDGRGVFREENVSLLHTRLAVIDLKGGRQPMALSHQGEDYILIYNGELYNTDELRRELRSLGHRFEGHSDTEVVLHAYVQWKDGCVDRLNGIFAFAVWEGERKRLFLARDRIGVKPLFYARHQGGLLFASEIKTLFCYPTFRAELDAEGAAELILLGPGRLPGSGVFRNVRELEPGWCGYYECGKLQLRQYWKLRDREHTDSFEETSEKVRFLVLDAIRRQMVSDVPIGTFLSGGLDSSIISAVCAEQMKKTGELLATFSVDYCDNERFFKPNAFQPESDGAYIRIMQEHLNSNHKTTLLSADDLYDSLEEATIARDLPGMADVDFSLLAFCREVRKNVKVALSGECADEIFGGYPWYRDPKIREQEGFPWAQNTAQRASLMSAPLKEVMKPREFVMDAYNRICRQSDILSENSFLEHRMKEMVNLNFRCFMQTLLDRKDRMSMYSSLEVRVPFCDYRIAEYLYTVPWEYKDYGGREKGLLRHAMEGLLPTQVLYRKKSPYPKTFDPQYTRLLECALKQILHEDAPVFCLISRDGLLQFLQQESIWPWYGQLMRRPQTIAYLLQLNFWLQHYQVELLY